MTRHSSDSAGSSWRRLLSIWMAASALLVLLASYGSGSGDSGSTQTGSSQTTAGDTQTGATTGVFVDEPVQGLHYASGASSGTTGPEGSFRCMRGEAVKFSVGGVTLGSTRCASVVTPLDLVQGADGDQPQVQAIASFLQSLDGDGDPRNGVINIASTVQSWIAGAMADRGLGELELTAMSPDDIAAFTQAVVARSQGDASATNRLSFVPPADAAANLVVAMAKRGVFRKNISDAPGRDTDGVTMEVMDDVRVPPRRADGGDPSVCDTKGNCITPDTVNPLLAFYVEPPGNKSLGKPFWGNDDAWVAVSLDDGATWKRTNLSNSSDKTVAVGDDPYADVNQVNGAVAGNKVLVTWISTYCPSSNPMELAAVQPTELDAMTPEDIRDPAVYNTYDLFKLAGQQGAADYTDPENPAEFMYAPEVGRVAFHCVWAARGVLDGGTGDITWYAPEQITSGNRDANLNMAAAGISPDGGKAAFAILWQADPIGLSKGEGAGEGEGWCGSHTSKGTDVWYTSISAQCFAQTGDGGTAPGCYAATSGGGAGGDRPRPAFRMSAPVPVSNDSSCVLGPDGWSAPYCQPLAKAFGTMLQTSKKVSTTFARSGQKNPLCAVKNIDRSPYWTDSGWPAAMGTLQQQCDSFDAAANSVPLDGSTGAARPHLQIVYDEHIGDMRAVLAYEEHKALGFLCKGDATCQAERLDYKGKFVLFNSFPVERPAAVDAGGLMNTLTTTYMDTNQDGVGDTVRTTSGGTEFRYIFENARNAQLAVQDANNGAYGNGRIGATDLRMVIAYKQGLFMKSQTSDLMLRRACGGYEYGDWGSCADAEAGSKGVARDPTCISCETVTRAEPGDVMNRTECSACHGPAEADYTSSDSAINAKALGWRFEYNSLTDNNLYMDPANGISKSVSSYDPLDDIKAGHAHLAGDMVLVSYSQAPNWALAHHFKAPYDLFMRRSFDGGFSWTSADGSRQEGAINLSHLPGAAEEVEEPELRIPVDCGFNAGTGASACPDAYGTNRPIGTIPLVATYCTGLNADVVVAPEDIGKPVEAIGRDCFFALSSDLGETFFNPRDTSGDSRSIAVIAANHDTAKGAKECQGNAGDGLYCNGEQGFDFLAHGNAQMLGANVRLEPSVLPGVTHTLHSVWLQDGTITAEEPYNGVDAWYRRFDFVHK